jgi:hypothetical protein
VKEDRPYSKFPGRARNLVIGFSCRHSIVFCASSSHKLGHPRNSSSNISTLLYSTVKDHMELAFTVVKRNEQIH